MNPLSPVVVDAWARQRGVTLSDQEQTALYLIDTALRSTGEEKSGG